MTAKYKLHLSLPTALFIFPVSFLSLFQFFSIFLSRSNFPLNIIILLGFTLALFLSVFISRKFSVPVYFTVRQLLIVTTISTIATTIFILRLSNGIPDLYCATGVLGLINQILSGHFPVSFQSFPEFEMNYHQGFIFITAFFAKVFGLSAVVTLKVLFPLFFFLMLFGVMSFLVKIKNPYYFIPPFLFIFITSAGTEIFKYFNAPHLGQISILEFSTNNSWPLALLVITCLLFISLEYKNKKDSTIYVGLLVLSLSTINAIAYQTVVFVLSLFYIFYLVQPSQLTRQEKYRNFFFICSLSTIVLLIPRFIPSAFKIGALYSSPNLVIRFISPESTYLGDVTNLFLIMNIIAICALAVGIYMFRKSTAPFQLLTIGLTFSIVFPLVFRFSSVVDWDMLHKFSFLAMFISAIIIPVAMSTYPNKVRFFGVLIFIGVMISSQTIYEMVTARMNFNYPSSSGPYGDSLDVIKYLSENKSTLIPYLKGDTILHRSQQKMVFCATYADYSAIAQFSGNFIRDTYDTNFLLNEGLEKLYFTNSTWDDFDRKLADVVAQVQAGDTLIVDRYRLDPASKKRLDADLKNTTQIEFERYILYQK